MRNTLSEKIWNSLYRGKERLSPEAILHFTNYVRSQMLPDQSFMNKAGNSDLYYTVFGWMLCLVLQIKLNTQLMQNYLNEQNENDLDLVHYACLKRCELISNMALEGKLVTGFKRLRGKKIKDIAEFSQVPHNDTNAPYSQYIWLSLLEDSGNNPKSKELMFANLDRYKSENGGYKNFMYGDNSTTNATVAALAVLGQLEGYNANHEVEYLQHQQNLNGGFTGTDSSPMPDLLSTATALFILQCYQIKPLFEASGFIEAHWLESGGFAATLIDDKSDVEYSFYGLLALGCA